MKKKCFQCQLVNYPTASACIRCGSELCVVSSAGETNVTKSIARRSLVLTFVCLASIAGFYASLVFSAKSISYEQRKTVSASIDVLEERGFQHEAFLLRRLAVFQSNDNWLNASVAKENAFAAANFPFAIVTLYSDFFTYPVDEIERAAILLHEAKHIEGAGEKEAYEFVWRNREKLGWTSENYSNSTAFNEIRKQTREVVPNLFVCDVNPHQDCTEHPRPGVVPKSNPDLLQNSSN